MIPFDWFNQAASRLVEHIKTTPLQYDPTQDIYLKWENQQVTGSFKARGAINKVLSLQTWEQRLGLVAASAGNHGQGVALAGKLVDTPVIVYAPQSAVPAKLTSMRNLGADVRLVPGGYGGAEAAGIAYARASRANWISPYNDGQVIAGQGTLGMEIMKQVPSGFAGVDRPLTWIVPVGGGGLMAGICCALFENVGVSQQLHHMVAVQSEASPFFHSIIRNGTQGCVQELPSLADGLSGPVEIGSLTIPILKRYLSDFILVSEQEIAHAVVYAWKIYGQLIEGSGAASLAAVLSGKIKSRPAVLIISGGNIQPEVHAELCNRFDV